MPADAGLAPVAVSFFILEIPGAPAPSQFLNVSGLSTSVELVEGKQADAKGQIQRNRGIGQTKYGAITCSHGVTKDKFLFDWVDMVAVAGKPADAIKDCTLTLYDAANESVGVWALTGVLPTGISVGTIALGAAEQLTLSLTLDCLAIKRQQ
jgi:phage tail-like protein